MTNKNLPPLIKILNKGSEAGAEFERLITKLLINHGYKNNYTFIPGATRGDFGVDGRVETNYPGMDNPVIFQCKWLASPITKSGSKRQITESLERLLLSGRVFKSYVLVTPENLSHSEREWLEGLPGKYKDKKKFLIHYIGHDYSQVEHNAWELIFFGIPVYFHGILFLQPG